MVERACGIADIVTDPGGVQAVRDRIARLRSRRLHIAAYEVERELESVATIRVWA